MHVLEMKKGNNNLFLLLELENEEQIKLKINGKKETIKITEINKKEKVKTIEKINIYNFIL